MKTETQITKENIKGYQSCKRVNYPNMLIWEAQGRTHKASCQRFLEFLEDIRKEIKEYSGMQISVINSEEKINKKTTDLKQAIKLYEDNGI